jgi:penicillin amidase
MSRALRFGALTAVVLAGVAIVAVLAGWLVLRASLPSLDGHAVRTGVHAEVRVSRDAAGVPTITAQNRSDLAFALGYLHAQDRFFQMDLLRRAAAGELAALLGPALLPADRELRRHRFRDVAERAVASLDAPSRALLDAYANGANAGLSALRARPFEYWLLRAEPKPWNAVDTVLCAHAMFLQLQDSTGHLQLQRGLLRATLPEALWRFIEAGAPEWDAAIDGSHGEPPRIPTPDEIDLRSLGVLPVTPPETLEHSPDPAGSNNWAVAGSRTADGAALVANDMHLGLRVPNVWYRARLVESSTKASDAAEGFDAVGLTLPGVPSLVVGSNGHIAWGFTNSYGEFAKVIRLVPVPGDPDAYAIAGGTRKLRYVDEIIEVKGAPSEHLKVALTPWGPVMGTDWQNRPYALDWVAHDPAAVNMNLLAFERCARRVTLEFPDRTSSWAMPRDTSAGASPDGCRDTATRRPSCRNSPPIPSSGSRAGSPPANGRRCSTRPKACSGRQTPASSVARPRAVSALTGWTEARVPRRFTRTSRRRCRPWLRSRACGSSSTTAPRFSSAGGRCSVESSSARATGAILQPPPRRRSSRAGAVTRHRTMPPFA